MQAKGLAIRGATGGIHSGYLLPANTTVCPGLPFLHQNILFPQKTKWAIILSNTQDIFGYP
jgi:hypothetical protein